MVMFKIKIISSKISNLIFKSLIIFVFFWVSGTFLNNNFTMAQVRETAVAGQFYTDNPEKLNGQIKDYLDNTENSKSYNNSKVVIVPHAGYVFSGQIATDGISKLNKQKIKR